jgi:Flp pilus assembly pilin Flp
VREDMRRDRGGSVIEVGLLLAGMSAVMLPALVLLGQAVNGALGAPCTAMGNSTCAVDSGGGSSGGGSGGGATGTPTQQLEARVAAQVPDPGGGSSKAKCNHQSSTQPPRGSTAHCNVKFSSSGQTRTYSVLWVDDAGTIQVVPT